MLQYVIIARDGNDADALERRMNARPNHFQGARMLKDNNNLVLGGAILDENGKMAGSEMIVQFESEEAMKKWFDNEPCERKRLARYRNKTVTRCCGINLQSKTYNMQ